MLNKIVASSEVSQLRLLQCIIHSSFIPHLHQSSSGILYISSLFLPLNFATLNHSDIFFNMVLLQWGIIVQVIFKFLCKQVIFNRCYINVVDINMPNTAFLYANTDNITFAIGVEYLCRIVIKPTNKSADTSFFNIVCQYNVC